MNNFFLKARVRTFLFLGLLGVWPAWAHHPHPLPETFDNRTKAVSGNVTLERALDSGNGQVLLTLKYYLYSDSPFATDLRISVWIRMNGREGMFAMDRNENHVPYFYLTVSNMPFDCEPNLRGGPARCSLPTPEMLDLLTWAKRSDPSQPNGHLNAWDVEAAFVDEAGVWDNYHGGNFRFRLEE